LFAQVNSPSVLVTLSVKKRRKKTTTKTREREKERKKREKKEQNSCIFDNMKKQRVRFIVLIY